MLKFWSTDAVGNVEDPTVANIFIRDLASPGVTANKDLAYLNGMSVEFVAADEPNGSGIASISYRLDGAPTQTVPAAAHTLTPRRPGDHECMFWTTDKAGNASPPATVSFNVVVPTRFVISSLPAPSLREAW